MWFFRSTYFVNHDLHLILKIIAFRLVFENNTTTVYTFYFINQQNKLYIFLTFTCVHWQTNGMTFLQTCAWYKIISKTWCLVVLACRSRQASIVLERYFRFEISLLSILCMLIARMEMGTSRVSGDSDIIT